MKRWCLILLLSVQMPLAWGVACDAVFTNGVQSHSPGGTVIFGGNAVVTGGGQTLSSASLSMQNWGPATCGGAVCNASGSPAASSAPIFVTGNPSDGTINVPSNQTRTRASGNYNAVNVGQNGTLEFTTTNGTYLTRAFTTNFRSMVELRPGDYWINGNLTLGQETLLRRVGATGTTRIFVNGNVSMGFRVATENFSPHQLLIYATGSITTANEAQLSAQIYAGGNVAFGFASTVNGSIAGATVDIAQNMTVNWSGAAVINGNFAPFCEAAPPAVLVSHWAMDELLWDGISGEVLDSSGNGNHATASSATTAGSAPAIPGSPGSCRYGVFDGIDDYLAAPGLSSTLNATASLAFWINTTQTGNDTAWSAPAVTGVEQDGGTDDIFWGWLDASGRIGVTVGDDNSTKSNTRINTGSWQHVVLTRDHQAGTYQVYINGVLDANGTIASGVIGTSYNTIGRVERTSGTPVYLHALLDEVHVFRNILAAGEVLALMQKTRPCQVELCPDPNSDPQGGLLGYYYNTINFSGEPAGSRVDGPINFNWGSGAPGVSGVDADQFSIDWTGYIRATESGNYYFQTASDDGVRLWVNGQLVIERWNDHAVEIATSLPVNLIAGQVYPVQLQFYENGGEAEIRLRWRTPTSNSFVPIPQGPAPDLGQGLYHCSTTTVSYYSISHSGNGVTCEAEPILISAHDSSGNLVAPPAGTEVVLGTNPGTGVWVGGNVYIFSGSETQFIAYLQQTSPATLNIDVTDGTATEIANADPNITFADTGLRFYGSTALDVLPNQVAGTVDANPVLRIVRTDNNTGACVARVQNRSLNVNLGYECRNPSSCVSGQSFQLNGIAVAPNHNGAAINYTPVNVNFDSSGFANIPLMYTDVGEVLLHGQINLPAEGVEPALSIAGRSNTFVVKPHTLVVSRVESNEGKPNPGTQGSGDGFVAAGDVFVVRTEARNNLGNITPNYGNELTSQVPRLEFHSLVYPAAGYEGQLTGTTSFSAQGNGVAENASVSWNEVGSIRLTPRLAGNNYLGAGDLVSLTPSDVIGRFYPLHYTLESTTQNACINFTYMDEPAIKVNYTLQARNIHGSRVHNYDVSLGYLGTATVDYVAENNDQGTDLDREIIATGQWLNGQLSVNDTEAVFARASAPEAPLESLQLGLTLTDALDSRPLLDLDMNPVTTGDCIASGNCTAKALGSPLALRYGRLFLASAYGPEVLNLPVRFATEFYNGVRWQRNALDTCTSISRDTVRYPAGAIDNEANRTVNLGGGTTTGQYSGSSYPDDISFTSGQVDHFFTAPGTGGRFEVRIDLTDKPWLQFDWDNGAIANEVLGQYQFGSYRGHDRIIYWREVLQQ